MDWPSPLCDLNLKNKIMPNFLSKLIIFPPNPIDDLLFRYVAIRENNKKLFTLVIQCQSVEYFHYHLTPFEPLIRF